MINFKEWLANEEGSTILGSIPKMANTMRAATSFSVAPARPAHAVGALKFQPGKLGQTTRQPSTVVLGGKI
jgi:hypothetical protein